MRYEFLSDEWFRKVDELIAAAGDLKIPAAMKLAVNVTVTSPRGDVHVFLKEGTLARGHRSGADAKLTLTSDLAHKLFVDGNAAAGVQAFLAGQVHVEGDLGKVVAMQTVEPSAPQKALTEKIAAITA